MTMELPGCLRANVGGDPISERPFVFPIGPFFVLLLLIGFGCTVRHPIADARQVAAWEKMPTPPAGSVRAITRMADGTILAGANNIYASRDDGKTWSPGQLEGIESLFTTRAGTLLAGTYRAGLFRSEDSGMSWQRAGFDRNVYLFGIVQAADGTIYLSATGSVNKEPQGVFQSNDDGRTWLPAGLATTAVFSLSALSNGAVWAGTDEGLFVTLDGGRTWTFAGDGIPKHAVVSSVISAGGSLLAATGMRQDAQTLQMPGQGVFKSKDGGKKWERFDAGLPPQTSVRAILAVDDAIVAATGGGGNSGGSGIYRSVDSGPWTQTGLQGEWLRGLIRLPSGRLLAAANDTAMFRSDDGGLTWTASATGFANWETFGIAARNGCLFASTQRGMFVWRDGGRSWDPTPGPSPAIGLFAAENVMYGGGAGVFMSRDSGSTWVLRSPADLKGFVRDVFVDSHGRMLAAVMGGGTGLCESEDGGKSWKRLLLVPNDADQPEVFSVAVTSSATILAGASNGMQRSDAEGNFEVVNGALAFAIRACPGDAIYAATYEKGLLRSTDEGRTWAPVTERQRWNARQAGYLTLLSILCLRDGSLLVGSLGDGVFWSRDHGSTWSEWNNGLRDLDVWGLAEDDAGNIFASTGNGIYRLSGHQGGNSKNASN